MDKAGGLWFRRPGIAHDPRVGDLSTTVIEPGRTGKVARAHSIPDPPVDCFYVYPTASMQSTPNATLSIDPGIV